MCHKLPAMLSNRVFPVLVVTAKRGKHSFVVVQIPVDISGLREAMYSNGRNLREGDTKRKRKKPILGYECQSNILVYSPYAKIPSVSIQASSAARCFRTRISSGSWLQLVTQKAGYQCGPRVRIYGVHVPSFGQNPTALRHVLGNLLSKHVPTLKFILQIGYTDYEIVSRDGCSFRCCQGCWAIHWLGRDAETLFSQGSSIHREAGEWHR